MAQNTWGGKRAGAGRRKLLTDVERLSVGAHCERLSREAVEAANLAERDRNTVHARTQVTKAKRVPVRERRAWLASESFRDHTDDVRGALQQDQGIDLVSDDRDPLRGFELPMPKRPKGLRSVIIGKVAERCGLTKSMVNECWKEFRATVRELEADDTSDARALNADIRRR